MMQKQNDLTSEEREGLLKVATKNLKDMWVSFPFDGYCTTCRCDLVDRYANSLGQADSTITITGCPACHRSFCE